MSSDEEEESHNNFLNEETESNNSSENEYRGTSNSSSSATSSSNSSSNCKIEDVDQIPFTLALSKKKREQRKDRENQKIHMDMDTYGCYMDSNTQHETFSKFQYYYCLKLEITCESNIP